MEKMVEEFIKHHGDTPENLPEFWETCSYEELMSTTYRGTK